MKHRRSSKANRHRQTFARGKRIWLLRIMGGLVIGAGILYLTQLGASSLLDPAALPYRSVTIEGSFRHIDPAAVRATVAPYLGAGFFGVDVDDVQHALLDMPWIDNATVRRIWPDEIRITVYEQTPVAHWGDKGLLNSTSKLFIPESSGEVGELPHLQGPAGSESYVMESYRAMSEVLKPYDLAITTLVLDERRAWHLSLDNHVKLVLGRHSTMDRLQRFVRFYPAVLAGRAKVIDEIDLRYTNGFVVRWNVPKDKAFGTDVG